MNPELNHKKELFFIWREEESSKKPENSLTTEAETMKSKKLIKNSRKKKIKIDLFTIQPR